MHLHHSSSGFSERERRMLRNFGAPADGGYDARLKNLEMQNQMMLAQMAQLQMQNQMYSQQLQQQVGKRTQVRVRGMQGMMIGSAPMSGMQMNMLTQYHQAQLQGMQLYIQQQAAKSATASGNVPYNRQLPPTAPPPPWNVGFGRPPIVPILAAVERGIKRLQPGDRVWDAGAAYEEAYRASNVKTKADASRKSDIARKPDAEDAKKLEERMKRLKIEADGYWKSIERMRGDVGDIRKQEAAHTETTKGIADRLAKFMGQRNDADKQIAALEKSHGDAGAAVDADIERWVEEADKAVKDGDVEGAKKVQENIKTARQEWKKAQETFNANLKTLRDTQAEAVKQVAALESEADKASAQSKKLAASRKKLVAQLREVRAKYSKVHAEIHGRPYEFVSFEGEEDDAEAPRAPEPAPDAPAKKKAATEREAKREAPPSPDEKAKKAEEEGKAKAIDIAALCTDRTHFVQVSEHGFNLHHDMTSILPAPLLQNLYIQRGSINTYLGIVVRDGRLESIGIYRRDTGDRWNDKAVQAFCEDFRKANPGPVTPTMLEQMNKGLTALLTKALSNELTALCTDGNHFLPDNAHGFNLTHDMRHLVPAPLIHHLHAQTGYPLTYFGITVRSGRLEGMGIYLGYSGTRWNDKAVQAFCEDFRKANPGPVTPAMLEELNKRLTEFLTKTLTSELTLLCTDGNHFLPTNRYGFNLRHDMTHIAGEPVLKRLYAQTGTDFTYLGITVNGGRLQGIGIHRSDSGVRWNDKAVQEFFKNFQATHPGNATPAMLEQLNKGIQEVLTKTLP